MNLQKPSLLLSLYAPLSHKIVFYFIFKTRGGLVF